MVIKILGAGCQSCHRLEENVVQAIKKEKCSAVIQKVTDISEMMQYQVVGMPSLVVNEKVVSSGRVLSTVEIITLIHQK